MVVTHSLCSRGFQAAGPCFLKHCNGATSDRPWPGFAHLGHLVSLLGVPRDSVGLCSLSRALLGFQLLPLLSPESHAFPLLSQSSAWFSVLVKGTHVQLLASSPGTSAVLCLVSYTAPKSSHCSPILLSPPAPWSVSAHMAGSRWALLSPSQETDFPAVTPVHRPFRSSFCVGRTHASWLLGEDFASLPGLPAIPPRPSLLLPLFPPPC